MFPTILDPWSYLISFDLPSFLQAKLPFDHNDRGGWTAAGLVHIYGMRHGTDEIVNNGYWMQNDHKWGELL